MLVDSKVSVTESLNYASVHHNELLSIFFVSIRRKGDKNKECLQLGKLIRNTRITHYKSLPWKKRNIPERQGVIEPALLVNSYSNIASK